MLCGIVAAQDAVKSPATVKASEVTVTLTPERAALKAELEAILDTDQKHRTDIAKIKDEKERAKFWAEQLAIDKLNQARIDEILKTHGWPAREELGSKASQAVFLVVQHSNLEMMKRYLPLLKAAMDKDDFWKGSYALLYDRICMIEGRPQLYGSQLQGSKGVGKLFFWKIEDEGNVDKRRAEMGLEPLAEYAQRFENIDYVPYSGRASKPPANKVEAKK